MEWLLTTVRQYISVQALIGLTVLSVVFFVGSLVAIPFLLVRLPEDYFDMRKPRPWLENHHPALRLLGRILKNILGVIFLFAGFLMLFLPGQGVLTMLIGISMLDFPGKRKVEARIISQPSILNVINRLRVKFGAAPLVLAPNEVRL
ncbi:MAG: hypothetical protein EBS01_03250 [Verrucomicrobia bacterium]|nr:hypothetical protein [Verrucomicrobiota bacterium]